MQFGTDAAAGEPQVVERDLRNEPLRRLEKRLERQAIVLIIVLPRLKADRRADPHVAAGRSRQMRAEAVARRVRRRIHERLDERSFRRRQFRVLAAARIDRERLAAQESRYLVCIESRRVDDGPRENRFASGLNHHAAGLPIGGLDDRTGKKDCAGRLTRALQRLHQLLGVDDARFRREERGDAADCRLALRDKPCIDEFEPLDAVGRPKPLQRFEPGDLGVFARDDELPAVRVRHVVLHAEVVQQMTSFDA